MKRTITSLLLCFGILIVLSAQLKVSTSNNIGIGTETPASRLSVGSSGSSSYMTHFYDSNVEKLSRIEIENPTGNYSVGLSVLSRMSATGATRNIAGNFFAYSATEINRISFGVRSIAGRGTDGKNYGVYGSLVGDRKGAAIVGVLNSAEPTISRVLTGYFDGNVEIKDTLFISSTQYTSDIRLKTDISTFRSSEGESTNLDNLLSLNPIRYRLYRHEELNAIEVIDSTTNKVQTLDIPDISNRGKHIGLSAQEVQKVYPELISESEQGYLAIDYIGLIPVLIEGMREQQAAIEALRNELDALKSERTE